ncbi:MAG: hypothetical protein SFY66_09980 [Oculatellaceae cyanobacterium bins.114]|nr:hypothetical protein [Oculatellaceae cyanobacterium bins.114]
MLILAIASFLGVICFGVGEKLNPEKKKEREKSPEEKFGEALTAYAKHLNKELGKSD